MTLTELIKKQAETMKELKEIRRIARLPKEKQQKAIFKLMLS